MDDIIKAIVPKIGNLFVLNLGFQKDYEIGGLELEGQVITLFESAVVNMEVVDKKIG